MKSLCQVQALPVFEKLKAFAGEGYFEELIRKYLLDNTHGSVITLVPSKGLAARKEKALEEKLQAHLESLSPEEREALVQKTKDLELIRKRLRSRVRKNVFPC